jgi:hypothetical protein
MIVDVDCVLGLLLVHLLTSVLSFMGWYLVLVCFQPQALLSVRCDSSSILIIWGWILERPVSRIAHGAASR